jgi:hypothetical protein
MSGVPHLLLPAQISSDLIGASVGAIALDDLEETEGTRRGTVIAHQ